MPWTARPCGTLLGHWPAVEAAALAEHLRYSEEEAQTIRPPEAVDLSPIEWGKGPLLTTGDQSGGRGHLSKESDRPHRAHPERGKADGQGQAAAGRGAAAGPPPLQLLVYLEMTSSLPPGPLCTPQRGRAAEPSGACARRGEGGLLGSYSLPRCWEAAGRSCARSRRASLLLLTPSTRWDWLNAPAAGQGGLAQAPLPIGRASC